MRIGVGIVLLCSPALALTDAPAPLPAAIETCSALRQDSERLACYDKAVADIRAGRSTSDANAQNMFGANEDTRGAADQQRNIQRDELREITAKVTSLRRTPDGMMLLELDNGQVWRQLDSESALIIEVADTVKVARASMGTFRISDKRGRSARFRRMR
jgi:hypothetical protein